ncbi:MAG: CPBP family glutamic-type intramembrane protease [Thermoproteus sp.]
MAGRQGGAGWVPVVDSFAIFMIVGALFIFFYFMVGYRFLEVFYRPATIMVIMLASSLAVSQPLTGARYEFSYMSFSMSVAGVLAGLALVTVQFAVGAFGVPAQGVVVEVSPILLVLFYASVGVAEEAFFTLMVFGSLARNLGYSAGHVVLYAFFASILFAAYHNFAALQIFGTSIFRVSNYSLVLIVGGLFLKLLFYFTRHISVSMAGHATLNAIVQSINIGLIRAGVL